jgi:primary-amine oxidase
MIEYLVGFSLLLKRPWHNTVYLNLIFSLLILIVVVTNAAGNDPVQGSTVWLDRYFGMGGFTKDLMPQYDCPVESVYLPATTFTILGNLQRQRAICIFEQDVGKPLSRHYGYVDGETGAVKSYVLTIRTINTLGK